MNKSKIIIALATFMMAISCSKEADQKTVQKEVNPFSGLWSLAAMEQLNSETGQWQEWRNGMQGYILYDDQNNMSVHLTTSGYQDTEIRFPNFTDTISTAALKHLTGSYVYVAKYKVDKEEGTVEHARISHSNPGDWNKIVKRRYDFKGDTLILQPVETANSNLRLKWVKDNN